MKKKIIGVTVGTPTSPKRIEDEIKPIKTVNGNAPDKNGNVEVVGNDGYSIYYSSTEITKIARTISQDTVTVPEDRFVQVNDFIITANGWLCQITDIDTQNSKYKITALLMLKGYTGEKGEKGDPYTLTEEDKKSITDAVIEELPRYNGEVVE